MNREYTYLFWYFFRWTKSNKWVGNRILYFLLNGWRSSAFNIDHFIKISFWEYACFLWSFFEVTIKKMWSKSKQQVQKLINTVLVLWKQILRVFVQTLLSWFYLKTRWKSCCAMELHFGGLNTTSSLVI